MHIKYCLLTIFSYWISLSTFLPSAAAHKLIRAPADEDNFEESLPKRVEALISGENGELSTEQMLHELLAGFDDNFAVVSQKSDSEKKSKKPAKKKGKGKGKGNSNKKEPEPVVVIEESEDSEDEDDDDESDDKEDTVVIGRPDDKSDEPSNNGSGSSTVLDDDSDIKQVGARISDDYQHYEVLTCTMVEIPLDQKGIELTFNPISNTQKIMLSTSELTNCRHILESACPANAKFCQVQDLSEGTYLKLGEEVCHHNVAYLYLIPNNPADSLEFELKVSVTNEVECKVTEQQGPVVNIDQYCEGLSAEQCQENAADACSSKCMWVTCKVNNQDQQTQSSAYCASANTQIDSLQQTCSKSQGFASAAPENQVIEYPVCAAPSVDQSVEQSESGSHINILSILGITFGVSLALCLVFSCYYRYQFRHNKRELCSPPECCPNFLFPRNSNQMEGFMSSGNRHKEQEMSGDYQPPVL